MQLRIKQEQTETPGATTRSTFDKQGRGGGKIGGYHDSSLRLGNLGS